MEPVHQNVIVFAERELGVVARDGNVVDMNRVVRDPADGDGVLDKMMRRFAAIGEGNLEFRHGAVRSQSVRRGVNPECVVRGTGCLNVMTGRI